MTALIWPAPRSQYVSQNLAGQYHEPKTLRGEPPGYVDRDGNGPVSVRLKAAPGFTYQRWCHRGIDIGKLPTGSKVVAMLPGEVIERDRNDARGRFLTLAHARGWRSRYQHLSGFRVGMGDLVASGELIALSGASGFVSGAHLHAELWRDEAGLDAYYNIIRMTAGGDLAHLLDEENEVLEAIEDPERLREVTMTAGANVYDLTGRKLKDLAHKQVRRALGKVRIPGKPQEWYAVRLRVEGTPRLCLVKADGALVSAKVLD